jgi:hypothetical protein
MMLAGIHVPEHAIQDLEVRLRLAGADALSERLAQAHADGVALLALTIDERAVILNQLDDPPEGLAETARRPAQRTPVAAPRRVRLRSTIQLDGPRALPANQAISGLDERRRLLGQGG